MKLDKAAYDRLLYWIRERYNIYLKRLRGKDKPWTEDPILRSNFFTMPYREYDKTTKWVRHFIRDPNYDDPKVILALIIFRWFNYIPTGDILLGTGNAKNPQHQFGFARANLLLDWDPDEAKRRLGGTVEPPTQKRGKYSQKRFGAAYNISVPPGPDNYGRVKPEPVPDKVFTGAYNISNSGSTKTKLDRVIDDYINPMWEARQDIMGWFRTNCDSMQRATNMLQQFLGMGGSGFMAYEVICDLRFTGMLDTAEDTCTWTSMGPGASRGLHRMLGTNRSNVVGWKPKPPLGWQKYMRDLLQKINSDLCTSSKNAYEIADPLMSKQMPKFEMREVEHSLCEFDKYERVRTGEGKSKRTYAGNS